MGTYCSNPLQYLITEYGEDVGKFIAVQKSKEFFAQKYPEVKKELEGQTKQFQNQTLEEVNKESDSTLKNIQQKIEDTKKDKQTEIATYEKTTNKKFEEIVGIDQVKTKFQNLKVKSNQQVKEISNMIIGQADILYNKQQENLEAQKPKLPVYQNLPQCLKDKVMNDGVLQFAGKIDEEKKKQEEFIKNNVSFEAIKGKVGGSLPGEQIKKINSDFETNFNTVQSTIGGGKIMGLFG